MNSFASMIRVLRLLAVLLLAALQLCSPWVHAHSGQETGTSWHLPGLEALGLGQHPSPATVAASDWLAAADMIVTIGTGCELKAERLVPNAPLARMLPPIDIPMPVGGGMAALFRAEPPTGPPVYPRSVPRAPPVLA